MAAACCIFLVLAYVVVNCACARCPRCGKRVFAGGYCRRCLGD
jgi:hypothetical protein